jgi:F-box-like
MASLLRPLLPVDLFRNTGKGNNSIKLPPEILIAILEYIPRRPAPYRDCIVLPTLDEETSSPRDPLLSATLVSRAWNGPANTVLYRDVDVSSVRAAQKLLRTLKSSPIGTLITSLHLPRRTVNLSKPSIPVLDFPSGVGTLLVDIIACCPNLHTIATSVSSYISPTPLLQLFMEPGQATRIVSLYLAKSCKNIWRDTLELPFPNLNILTLSGFTLHSTSLIPLPQSLHRLTLIQCVIGSIWPFRYNRARASSLRWLGLHHCQGLATRIPDHIGLSLTQLDIDRTTGVETQFECFSKLKVFRWGDHLGEHPLPSSLPTSIEHLSLYGRFSNNDIACITRHMYALESLSLYNWATMEGPKWVELGWPAGLAVKVSEIGWSILGALYDCPFSAF